MYVFFKPGKGVMDWDWREMEKSKNDNILTKVIFIYFFLLIFFTKKEIS